VVETQVKDVRVWHTQAHRDVTSEAIIDIRKHTGMQLLEARRGGQESDLSSGELQFDDIRRSFIVPRGK
jgi:hypothetical protein